MHMNAGLPLLNIKSFTRFFTTEKACPCTAITLIWDKCRPCRKALSDNLIGQACMGECMGEGGPWNNLDPNHEGLSKSIPALWIGPRNEWAFILHCTTLYCFIVREMDIVLLYYEPSWQFWIWRWHANVLNQSINLSVSTWKLENLFQCTVQDSSPKPIWVIHVEGMEQYYWWSKCSITADRIEAALYCTVVQPREGRQAHQPLSWHNGKNTHIEHSLSAL